ncbi:MAG TPA: MarR family transcriptional regulator [Candidatus Corynebacterium avicola]|uniref:MarR family transcriptional regulator n=1 Tax=Candidatus Corynebacterium avicola TaxID=2838527 RepID=A0A9D1RQR3_9CORY|nr:MarR family transcriptional regulator [Candidatus Corynebacterium avicola]
MERVKQVASLADTVVRLARRIQVLEMPEGVVFLSNLETIVMNRIDDAPGITPKQLAKELNLKSSNTSAALRQLEAKGLADRRPDPSDGRGACIFPTPFAEENLRRVQEILGATLDEVLTSPRSFTDDGGAPVSDEDLATTLSVLCLLHDGVGSLPESQEPGL